MTYVLIALSKALESRDKLDDVPPIQDSKLFFFYSGNTENPPS